MEKGKFHGGSKFCGACKTVVLSNR